MTASKFQLSCIFIAALGFCGCRIDFEGQSIVREDGTIERTTLLSALDQEDEKRIAEFYTLIPGGQWQAVQRTYDDKTKEAQQYAVKNTIAPQSGPTTDFILLSSSKDKSLKNSFVVKTSDYWFLKRFHYEERFTDTVDRENLLRILNEIKEYAVKEAREKLALKIPDPKLVEDVTRTVNEQGQVLINQYVKLIKSGNWQSDELEAFFKSGELMEQSFFNNLPGLSEENRKTIDTVLNEVSESVGERFSEYEDEILGAHGLGLFNQYGFEIRLQMPGKVTATNATIRGKEFLAWKFQSTLQNPYIYADSQKIYVGRVLLAAIGFLVLLFILFKILFRPRNRL